MRTKSVCLAHLQAPVNECVRWAAQAGLKRRWGAWIMEADAVEMWRWKKKPLVSERVSPWRPFGRFGSFRRHQALYRLYMSAGWKRRVRLRIALGSSPCDDVSLLVTVRESRLHHCVFTQLKLTQDRDNPRNQDTPWINFSPPYGFSLTHSHPGRMNWSHPAHTHIRWASSIQSKSRKLAKIVFTEWKKKMLQR